MRSLPPTQNTVLSPALSATLSLFVALLSLVLLAATPALAGEGDTQGEAAKTSKTIKWATASEVDNFGYDIYRGDHEEGPFERVNPEPIPGAGTTDEPTYYQYVDEGLDVGRTYYYWVESISIHGERERFTPVVKVVAKAKEGGSEEGSDDGSGG